MAEFSEMTISTSSIHSWQTYIGTSLSPATTGTPQNFLAGTVFIDHNHSGKGISGIIIFLHAVHYVLRYRFGSDDQQLLVAAVFQFFYVRKFFQISLMA